MQHLKATQPICCFLTYLSFILNYFFKPKRLAQKACHIKLYYYVTAQTYEIQKDA